MFPALFLLTMAGCDRHLVSDEGTLTFFAPDVKADALAAGFGAAYPVVAGSRVCGEVSGEDGEALGSRLDSCYEQAVEGPLSLDDDGCLLITGAGDLVWRFTSLGCSPSTLGFTAVDDRFSFSGIEGADLVATWDFWAERGVDAGDLVLDGAPPERWLPDPGDPLLVLADTRVKLPISLFSADGVQAAWVPAEAQLQVDGDGVSMARGIVEIRLAPGERRQLRLDLHGVDGDLGEVVAVSAADISSLEVVPAYYPDGEHRSPAGARALLRRADGAPVFGVPAEWKLSRGNLSVSTVTDDVGGDYTQLDDHCRKPSKRAGDARAILWATWGALAADAEVTWTLPDDPTSTTDAEELAAADAAWVRPDTCPSACGCSGGGGAAGVMAMLGGLLAALRRRRVSAPRGPAPS